MNNIWRAAIIALLVFAVIGIFGMKSNKNKDDSVSGALSGINAKESDYIPRLIDLGADKCIPCKKMFPVLDSLQEEYKGRLDVIFIDVWKNPDAKAEYKIKIIPTQIFYNSKGKEIYRHEGYFSKEDIIAKFKELGINL
ncbi:MAG: thioredoxin family protein [Armatimonadota bacterium]